MTTTQLINNIEEVRGIIKNKKKYEPMIDDINTYGSNKIIRECYERKTFGIEFIWDLVIKANIHEQDDFLRRYYSSSIKNKSVALMIKNDILK